MAVAAQSAMAAIWVTDVIERQFTGLLTPRYLRGSMEVSAWEQSQG